MIMTKRSRKQVGLTLSAEGRVLLRKLSDMYRVKRTLLVENLIREKAVENRIEATPEEIRQEDEP
jgi:hypothetical protein